jgi:hypothetical protein
MVMRIGLITTGECEQRGLADSLARVFAGSGVSFETCFAGPVESFTSSRLLHPAPFPKPAPTLLDKLVSSIAASIQRRDAPDVVFAVDDLELVNVATPEHVISLVREAVGASLEGKTHRERELFSRRCSLHLLCPMVEAYFFGEPEALLRAGTRHPALLEGCRPLERMRSAELEYLAPPDEKDHPWKSANRAEHPKRYIKYLSDPDDTGERRYKYREGKQGVTALATLNWEQVFAYQPPGLPFARSLFEDLADAIGVPCPFPGESHPLTARKAGGVLRNL